MNGNSSRGKKSAKKINKKNHQIHVHWCHWRVKANFRYWTCQKHVERAAQLDEPPISLTDSSSEVQGKPQSRLIRLHFCYSWNRCQNHKRMSSAKSRPPSLKLMHSGRDWENTCSLYAGSLWCGGKRNLIKAVHWSPMPVFTDYIHRVTSSFVAPWPDFPLLCLQNRFIWPIFTQTEDLVQ